MVKKPIFAMIAMFMYGLPVNSLALEKISDQDMANKTGEGLGLILEDLKIAADQNTYVRLTSAGGKLTPNTTDTNNQPVYSCGTQPVGTCEKKGEVYMYGYSLGGSHKKVGNTLVATDNAEVGDVTVGSIDNPLVLSMDNKNDPTNNVISVLSFNLPKATNDSATNTQNPATANKNKNLKLVTWVDVLGREQNAVQYNPIATNSTPERVGKEQFLRMQAMGNKLSLDGSQFNYLKTGNYSAGTFPTTGISSIDKGLADEKNRMETAYTNKFANYGVLRINYEVDKTNINNSGFFKWGVAQTAASSPANPTARNNTNPLGNEYGAYTIGTGNAPIFNENEGLFVKDFQINMPLGSIFQPTIIDTNGEGALTLEVARIPNIPAVYQKHYINYKDNKVALVADNAISLDVDSVANFQHNGTQLGSFVETNSGQFEIKRYLNSGGNEITALNEQNGYCTPTNCPDGATHATAYFRTFTHTKDGSHLDPTDANYAGYGVKPILDQSSFQNADKYQIGSAAINVNGGLGQMEKIATPTYNFAEGMVVNHLKITLNQ